METRVWSDERRGSILALTGDAIYLFSKAESPGRRTIPDLAAALAKGQPPATAGAAEVLPMAELRRVEVSPGRWTVTFLRGPGARPASLTYWVRERSQAPEIARAVVERAGLPPIDRREEIGLAEALATPLVVLAIAGACLALALLVAYAIGEGRDPKWSPRDGDHRAPWYGFVMYLAPLVAIVAFVVALQIVVRFWRPVGAVVLGSLAIWMAWRVVVRPKKRVWGEPRIA